MTILKIVFGFLASFTVATLAWHGYDVIAADKAHAGPVFYHCGPSSDPWSKVCER